MIPRCLRDWTKLLKLTLILMGMFAKSSFKQCEPETTLIFRNVGIKLCQLKCIEHGQCLSFEYDIETLTCRLLRDDSKKIEKKEGKSRLSKNSLDIVSGSCPPKMCTVGQRCLKTRSGHAVCVQDGKQTCTERPPQHDDEKEESFANSSLLDACKKGNLIRVRHILSRALDDVNRRHKRNRTLLMMAAKEGHRRIVEFLLSKGAIMSLVDNNGDSILHSACRGGHVDMVRYVLSQHSVDINSRSKSGTTPLMTTVYHGHIEIFDVLVGMGANMSQVDDNGENVLHYACRGGHVDMVRYVLSQHSVDINSRSKSGKTPLMTTVYHGHIEIFDVLVGMGANMSQVDDNGENVLHYACRGGHVGMVKHLLSNYSVDINSRGKFGRTALMTTICRGHRGISDVLVLMGANVSLVDDYGDNILHSACRGGHVGMVRYVLSQYSVDINSRSNSGKNPLMTTVYNGRRELFDVLVGMGAKVSQVDENGDNVLHWACGGGHVGMVKHLLLNYSVDINSRGKFGITPLMKTVYYGYIDVFKYLVSLGADVSYVDDNGDNILHLASMGGHAKMIQDIISKDIVDINSRGRYGRTPLMRAAYYGKREAFDVLVGSGCRTDLMDDQGHTILHLACLGGRVGMVKYIVSRKMANINARNNVGDTAAMIAKNEEQHACYHCLVSRVC